MTQYQQKGTTALHGFLSPLLQPLQKLNLAHSPEWSEVACSWEDGIGRGARSRVHPRSHLTRPPFRYSPPVTDSPTLRPAVLPQGWELAVQHTFRQASDQGLSEAASPTRPGLQPQSPHGAETSAGLESFVVRRRNGSVPQFGKALGLGFA